MAVPKRHRVDVWLPPDDLERARALSLARGHARKVPGEERRQGDLAGFLRAWMLRQNSDPERRARLYERLRRFGARLAASPSAERAVRWEFRVTEGDLRTLERAAAFAGFEQGGRGNVSAFLRALVRLAAKIHPQL